MGKIINTFVVSKREFSKHLKYFSISSESVWCHSEPLCPIYLLPLSTSLSLFRTLWCHHKLRPRNYTFWSFLAFFFLGLYLRKGSFPRSLYFLPTQTGFSGSCAPESATNPIGHSHLYEPTVLLQTWLAPQASGDWHSSRSTNQRYKEISTYGIESNKQPDNGQALKKAHPSAGNRELNWCIKISPTYVLVCRLHARRGRIHYSCQQHILKCFYFY